MSKRERDEGVPPPLASGAPPAQDRPNETPPDEKAALDHEIKWLKHTNAAYAHQLAQLQQQHAALSAAAAQAPPHHHHAAATTAAAAAAQQQQHQQHPASTQQHPAAAQYMAPQHQLQHAHPADPTAHVGPAAAPQPHQASAWSEQHNPVNGATYYWNSQTGESTYARPPDFGHAAGPTERAGIGTKGPPGANLFVVRKMRRGEYDAFDSEDLKREFGKYGTVTRAEIACDRETKWSKGFGFVSFATPQEADVALNALNGSWLMGRELKVEKTKEDS